MSNTIDKNEISILEYLVWGTGTDSVKEAVKFIDKHSMWEDLVNGLNNPRMWIFSEKINKTLVLEVINRNLEITSKDIEAA
jgi:hypothetical protein|tara:strand:+ start:308 stop:550 length:243 start_codon:yes stop_codon:yes gene_type:complete